MDNNAINIFTGLRGEMGSGIDKLLQCIIELQHWFWINCLLLNPDKSDTPFYGMRPCFNRPDLPSSISIAGCTIGISKRLKILGVASDTTLSFDYHITNIIRACNFQLRALCHICRRLDIARTMACSIICSRMTTAMHCCSMQLVRH